MFFDSAYIEKIISPEILVSQTELHYEMSFEQAATYFEQRGLRYELEERAAILEFCGGLCRDVAEQQAVKEIFERTK